MAGSIFLRKTETSVGESNATINIEIVRSGSTAGAVTIEYGIFADTATPGLDYIGTNGTIVMPNGASSILVPIQIRNDTLGEASELFTFTLIGTTGAELSAPRTNRITILDDETRAPPPPAEPPLVSPYDTTLTTLVTDLTRPVRFAFSPLDAQTLYIAEKDGMIRVSDLETGQISTFLDLRQQVNNAGDRGLLDVALHPDFANTPYVYAFFVVDPADTAATSGAAGADGAGNRYAHIVRYTADAATGYRTIVPGSEVVLVGATGQSLADISGQGALDYTEIANSTATASDRVTDTNDRVINGFKQDYLKVDNRSHAGGRLLFGPDGMLYAFTGDGTSYDYPDPRTPDVQSLDSLSGKVLRVDPITGRGLADNPFATQAEDLDANRAKIWQFGLRNPFSGAFDAEGNLFVADVGWFAYEEINMAGPGANFGWPFYEGADNGALFQTPQYRDFASAADFYAAAANGTTVVTPAYRAFSHNTIAPGYQVQAIIASGVVNDSPNIPAGLGGSFVFSNFVGGDLFAVSTTNRTDITYLTDWPGDYGPIYMVQGQDGALYYSDLYGGTIGRLAFAQAAPGDQPSLSIAAATASAAEGNSGSTAYNFTITRTGATATPFTVGWSATGAIGIGTAPADAADFVGGVLPSGTVSFAAGQTKATVTVAVAADTKGEQNERFAVTLNSPTAGTTISQANALATIVNDDTDGLAILAISGAGVTRTEGTTAGSPGGTTPFKFTVTRSGVTSTAISAEWSAAGAVDVGTIPSDASDFAGGVLPFGRVSFAPGQTKATVTVNIAADGIGELNERFGVTLSDASPGATIGTAFASAAVLNDDVNLALVAETVTRTEGHSGTQTFTFTATRRGTGPTATVDWLVQPYGAEASDFVGGTLPSGSLTFGPNDTTRTITVQTKGDIEYEPDDWFKVVLQVPSAGATITNDTAFGTILADDSEITLSNWNNVGYEANSIVSPYIYILTRNSATPAGQTVAWSVRGLEGPGTLPANGADFVGGVLPSGTVTWAEGEVRKEIIVPVAPDRIVEFNERFQVTLSNPTGGAHLGNSVATGVIMNDDARFTIGPNAVFAAEGNAGTTPMALTVTRTGFLNTIAAVSWNVTPGTLAGTLPISADDFAGGVLPSGELTFANGVTTQTITVNIAADRRAELNENFNVTLFNGSGADIAVATARGIVTDDDTIIGTTGNDSLSGTAGPDLFLIGQGQDTITAGAGRDQFRFLPSAVGPANSATFTDFNPADGERLDLSAIDAIAGTPGNQAFTVIGTNAFSSTPGELRWQDLGGGMLLVQGNVNADPAADLTITLALAGPVRSWWFVL